MDLVKTQKRLEAGWLFLHPTDTLPGIGCLSQHKESIQKIASIKKTTDDRQGFIALVGSFEQAISEYSKLHEKHLNFLQIFWPGPLTFVHESNHSGSLALRFPLIEGDHMKWFRDILSWAPSPLISTSVNESGSEHATNFKEAKEFVTNHQIKNIIVPETPSQIRKNITVSPSTIVKGELDGTLKILRKGNPDFIKKLLAFDPNIKVPS